MDPSPRLGEGAGDAAGDAAREGGALEAAMAVPASPASRRGVQQLGILARLFMAFLGACNREHDWLVVKQTPLKNMI